MRRHRGDVRWHEAMAATPAWVFAEIHRDKKRHRKPFSLYEWTITGLTKPRRRRERREAPDSLWQRISGAMKTVGGKRGDSDR